MIIKEYYDTREDGIKLYITKSDSGFYINKIGTNEIYEEAVDTEDCNFQYQETNDKINEG